MEHAVYTKKLCMSELRVERCSYEGTQYFNASAGEGYSSLTFLLAGQGMIRTMGAELSVKAGDLLYIPESERYDAVWSGMTSIDYISFHIAFHIITVRLTLQAQAFCQEERERLF